MAVALGSLLCFAAPRAAAQENSEVPQDEIVANLAAGRVVIAVVKDGIVIATVENRIEAQTRPPVPVELSAQRAGILLGAVEWVSPTTQTEIARLDRELPRLHGHMTGTGPHLQQKTEGEATDIQAIGLGLTERLNEIVKDLHSKINLPAGESIIELIIADYLQGYGPEVWQITSSLEQKGMRGEYFDTRMQHPRFLQVWPPDKGQPRALVEFHYPPEDTSPTLMELLRKNDPRLMKIMMSDLKMGAAAEGFIHGESTKIPAADTVQFLRAALDAISPPDARQTMAVIGIEKGFDWILPPPPEPKKPRQQKPRPEGAPTLVKPSE